MKGHVEILLGLPERVHHAREPGKMQHAIGSKLRDCPREPGRTDVEMVRERRERPPRRERLRVAGGEHRAPDKPAMPGD